MDESAPPDQVRTSRWRQDLPRAAVVLLGCVLMGAPAGLVWSAVAPRLTVTLTKQGPQASDLESTKAFIGADGSYLLVMLLVGALCGALAWVAARRSGPWTVGALVLGGFLGAVVASRVGLMPGSEEAIAALNDPSRSSGTIELFLGRRQEDGLRIRSPWAAVGWPVGALVAFLLCAFRRPEDLD